MQCDPEPLPSCRVTPFHDRCVVASDLGAACAVRGRSVKFFQHQAIERLYTVVGRTWLRVHGECEFRRCGQGEVATAAEDERADIEQGFGGVRGNECRVASYGQLDGFHEMGFGDGGDGDVGRGVREAGGVHGGPEDVDLFVWSAKSFQAFVGLLAVVQGWGEAVDAQIWICDEGRLAPLSGLDMIVGFDVAVDLFYC